MIFKRICQGVVNIMLYLFVFYFLIKILPIFPFFHLLSLLKIDFLLFIGVPGMCIINLLYHLIFITFMIKYIRIIIRTDVFKYSTILQTVIINKSTLKHLLVQQAFLNELISFILLFFKVIKHSILLCHHFFGLIPLI